MKKLEPNEVYHASAGIGSTFIKKAAGSTILHALTDEFQESDAMRVGTAVHCAYLEPEKFSSSVIVLPDDAPKKPTSRQVNAKKPSPETVHAVAYWSAFEKAAQGKTLLTKEQHDSVLLMVKSIKDHSIASSMLTRGEAEYSYYAVDPVTGLPQKCRPDYLRVDWVEENGVKRKIISMYDIKTCQDASVDGFTRQVMNLLYHVQAAHYMETFFLATGEQVDEFHFIAAENTMPHATNIHSLKRGSLELDIGFRQRRKVLDDYAIYLKDTNKLYEFGYEKKINEIVFPRWALEKWGA